MKATAVIERGKDGTYGVYIVSDNVPFGAIGDGKTVAEALEKAKAMEAELKEATATKQAGAVKEIIDSLLK